MRISRTALLALTLLKLVLACHKEEAKETAAAVSVRVERVARGNVADVALATGALEAPPGMDVRLAPITAGRLAQVLVAEGDKVRKGQVLARLDVQPLRDLVVQAEAQLAQARAQDSNAAIRLTRASQAFAAGVAAGQEVDDARLQSDSAKANIRTAEATLSTASNQLARGELRAPFDGVVARLLAPAGEPVDPGKPVVEVARVEVLELRAPVAPGLAMRLRPGQAASLSIDASPGSDFPATVLAVAPVLDPQSGAALVRLRVPNPQGRLKIGSLARARITLDTHQGALQVPKSALLGGEAGPAVEVVLAGKAKRVSVKLGYQDGEVAEVIEGVTEGQEVISQGAYALPDGTPVVAQTGAQAPAQAPAPAPAPGKVETGR